MYLYSDRRVFNRSELAGSPMVRDRNIGKERERERERERFPMLSDHFYARFYVVRDFTSCTTRSTFCQLKMKSIRLHVEHSKTFLFFFFFYWSILTPGIPGSWMIGVIIGGIDVSEKEVGCEEPAKPT